jgi:hypothetical protein
VTGLRALPAAASLLALFATPAHPAGAEVTVLQPPREVSVALTLYADGLSWVRETATVSTLRGESLLSWPGTVAALEPDTLSARILEGAASVTGVTPPRRVPSPEALLERWVGREVDLVQAGDNFSEKVTRGVLLGVSGGHPLMRVDSSLWVAPPGWLRLPARSGEVLPEPEPASIRISSAGGGKARIELSYRAPGLSWSASYQAMRHGEQVDFEGWVTLRNDTEVDFRQAQVKLLAGELQRQRKDLPVMGRTYSGVLTMAEGAAAPPPASREALGTTHLYTLSRPVDLPAAGQTRLVWVSRSNLPARLRYRLESQQGASYGGDSGAPPVHPASILSVEAGAFKEPLPAGMVRLFERDASGALQEVGEDAIVHLPAGAPFDLRTGTAFDILAERRQTEQNPEGRVAPAELAGEIKLRNSGTSAASVEVREFFNGRWKIEQSSHESRRVDARTAEFLVPVPAGGEATLTYRATVRY